MDEQRNIHLNIIVHNEQALRAIVEQAVALRNMAHETAQVAAAYERLHGAMRLPSGQAAWDYVRNPQLHGYVQSTFGSPGIGSPGFGPTLLPAPNTAAGTRQNPYMGMTGPNRSISPYNPGSFAWTSPTMGGAGTNPTGPGIGAGFPGGGWDGGQPNVVTLGRDEYREKAKWWEQFKPQIQEGKNLLGQFALSFKHVAFAAASWAIISTVTDMIKGLNEQIERSIDAAARMERYRRSYQNLRGAAGEENFEQVVSFARQTPFDLEQTITQSQRLVATGMQWEDVIPTMHAAANAIARVAGTNEQMAGLTKAMTDVQAKGKLAGQEIIQFSNAGVDILSVLADQTGKTRGQILKLSEAGEISGELVMRGFRNWSRDQGNFIRDQARDYLGLQQNIHDIRFELDAAFGNAAMQRRKDGMEALYGVLASDEAKESATAWGNMFGKAEGFGVTMQAVWHALNDLAAKGGAPEMINKAFGGIFDMMEGSSGFLNDVLKNLGYEAGNLETNLAGAAESLDGLLENSWEAKLRREIDALTEQNTVMERNNNLREHMRALSDIEGEIERNNILALDVFSPQGIGARERRASLNSQYEGALLNMADDMMKQRSGDRIAEIEDELAAGQPITGQSVSGGSIAPNVKRYYSGNYWMGSGFGGGQSVGGKRINRSGRFNMGSSFGQGGGPQGGVSHGVAGFCTNCATAFVVDTIQNTDAGRRATAKAVVREANRVG